VNEVPAVPASDNFYEDFASSQATPTPICKQNDQANQNQTLNNQGCKNP
jgi:hypothetical protein